MTFDVIVGNPPYGVAQKGSSPVLHLKIMNTALKFCTDKLVFIMPSKPIVSQLQEPWFSIFKNAVCNKIEVVGKDVFKGTDMDNTAIYYCDKNDDPKNYCKKLDVDNAIYNAIDSDAHRLFIDKMNKTKELKIGFTFGSKFDYLNKFDSFKKRANKDYYFLNVNRASNKSLFFTKTFLDIDILDYNDENNFLLKNTSVKNVISCPTKEYGENLKNLMINGVVLRYGLWLTQRDRNIVQTQFRYIPDLDYTNINNDEELLSSCGFTSDEIEKMMDYLKHFDFSKNRNDVVRRNINIIKRF